MDDASIGRHQGGGPLHFAFTVSEETFDELLDKFAGSGHFTRGPYGERGPYGIYHQMSPKHLQRYVDEFATRCNLNGASFDGIVSHTVMAMVGRRVTYGELVHGA